MRFHEHIKGDKAEYIAAMWLWDQGYLVCRNMSQQGPVDLVAIKEHEVILIDVKSECRRSSEDKKNWKDENTSNEWKLKNIEEIRNRLNG